MSQSHRNSTCYDSVSGRSLIEAYPIVSILPMIDPVMDTFGLQDNAIYDLVSTDVSGKIPVSAVLFDVACQNINGVAQTSDGYTLHEDGRLLYSFHVDNILNDIEISPGKILVHAVDRDVESTVTVPRSLNIVNGVPIDGSTPPLTIFVATTVPVVDNSSVVQSRVTVNPPACGISCGASEFNTQSFRHAH